MPLSLEELPLLVLAHFLTALLDHTTHGSISSLPRIAARAFV